MPLPIPYRNSIRDAVKTQVNGLIQRQVTPEVQSEKKWKFTNSTDFHYGHFVGSTQMNCSTTFNLFYNRQPNTEEMLEISEMIEEEGKPLREYLEKL